MTNISSIRYTLSALKLLDTLITLGYEEINTVLWIYMFDIPEIELDEGPNENYMPIISKTFLTGFNAKPRIRRRAEPHVGKFLKRKMQLAQEFPDNFEDLDRCAKTLLQFCMFYRSELGEADMESLEDGVIREITFS